MSRIRRTRVVLAGSVMGRTGDRSFGGLDSMVSIKSKIL